VLAIGLALTPFMTSGLGLIFSLGVLAAIGSGAGSFSVLIGAAARHLNHDKRGKAAGIINAGGSLGQFVFAPVAQSLIQLLGWMGAMWSLAVITVGALPLVGMVTTGEGRVHGSAGPAVSAPWQAVQDASRRFIPSVTDARTSTYLSVTPTGCSLPNHRSFVTP